MAGLMLPTKRQGRARHACDCFEQIVDTLAGASLHQRGELADRAGSRGTPGREVQRRENSLRSTPYGLTSSLASGTPAAMNVLATKVLGTAM